MRRLRAAVIVVTLVAGAGGCGLFLEASPDRRDAGADARSDLDAAMPDDTRSFPLDAPFPDTVTPLDAPFGDVVVADAPFSDDTGDAPFSDDTGDAPFSDDAREDSATEAGLDDDARPMTCACGSRGGCDIPECVFLGGALTCVHRDDSSMCVAGWECRSGVCVEPCGDGCTPVDTCETATCVLGVCQRASPVCAVGQVCVRGACIASSGACADDSGTIFPGGRVCRPSAGACDRPEVCDGISPTCPPDRVTLAGVMCRGGATCDPPEFCDGTSRLCPDNVTGIDGDFTCYSGSGVCDGTRCVRPGDTCVMGRPCVAAPTNCRSGMILCGPPRCEATTPRPLGSVCGPPPVGSACGGPGLCTDPGGSTCATVTIPRGAPCRDATGPCDPGEVCDGVTQRCPGNALAPAGAVCRPSTGECDPGEVCSGTMPGCPPDAVAAHGSSCGAPGGCSSCSSRDCVQSVDVGDPCPAAVGVCTEAGACAEGSCLVPGAPCAIGAMVGGSCTIAGRADATTVCRAATANCEGDALCPTPSLATPGDYSCPPNPSLAGASCAVTCGAGVAFGTCSGGVCMTGCTEVL